MKIAIDISSVAPGRTGVGLTTGELAARLPFVGGAHEFIYLFRSMRQPPPRFALTPHHVRLVHRRTPGPLLLSLWLHAGWPDTDALAAGGDLYHAPAMFLPPAGRVPLVATIHDLFFLDEPTLADDAPWGDGYFARALPRRLPAAARIICPSAMSAAQVRRHFAGAIPDLDARLRVIPWGVGPRWFLPPAPSDRRVLEALGLRRPYMLTVASSARRKNLPALLRACALLRRMRPGAPPLVCVGLPGPPADADDAARAAAGAVRFVPYCARRELGVILRNASLYVCSAWMEGFGLPVLEAMAAGVPVVTTPAVGVLEFTGTSAAHGVAEASAEALAVGMAAVLGDEGRRADLVRAGRAAAATLTWRRTAAETLAVYEEIFKIR
jgi:glycosyltransferase involved in cell wall biosynthesis